MQFASARYPPLPSSTSPRPRCSLPARQRRHLPCFAKGHLLPCQPIRSDVYEVYRPAEDGERERGRNPGERQEKKEREKGGSRGGERTGKQSSPRRLHSDTMQRENRYARSGTPYPFSWFSFLFRPPRTRPYRPDRPYHPSMPGRIPPSESHLYAVRGPLGPIPVLGRLASRLSWGSQSLEFRFVDVADCVHAQVGQALHLFG